MYICRDLVTSVSCYVMLLRCSEIEHQRATQSDLLKNSYSDQRRRSDTIFSLRGVIGVATGTLAAQSASFASEIVRVFQLDSLLHYTVLPVFCFIMMTLKKC